MNAKPIRFPAGDQLIAGEIIGRDVDVPSTCFFFHGGGRSSKARARQFFDGRFFAAVPNVVAIKMLETFEVESLILLAPGVYDATAFAVPFDQGFTEIIRPPRSWERSDAFPLLERFAGNLLLAIGENDDIIPPEAVGLIDRHASNAASKEILRFPGCGHDLPRWLAEHPEEKGILVEKATSLFPGSG